MTPQGSDTRRPASTVHQAFACAAFSMLAGCSLIVNLAEKDEDGGRSEADAETVAVPIDARPVADATPTAFCGPSLSETLAYFSFENDQDLVDLTNTVVGGAGAKSQSVQNNAFGDIGLTITDGPSGCGNAARMAEGENRVVHLTHVELGSVHSVDFWVRIDSVGTFDANTTILSKDANKVHNGDFGISVFRDVPNTRAHFILRIQREFQGTVPAEASFFLCSPDVTLDTWHHVAASATGQPAQFYVDGVLATSTPTIDPTYGAGSACNADPGSIGANTTTTSENPNDWVVAGSNGLSPDTVAHGFFSGSIDELRFRSAGFSQDDAVAAFGDGRQPVAAGLSGAGQP